MTKNKIAIAYGDGIGPEIMHSVLRIMESAGAGLETEEIKIGKEVYLGGEKSGISRESWEVLRRLKFFLKAPVTTPQGGGFQSLNVAIRKNLGLFANIRPCYSYAPFVRTHFPGMNLVIVRENEEDLYAGIEYRQNEDVFQSLKLVSMQGSEKIIRYAFEYALANNRKHVSCMTKDNIMKLTDGMFHKTFDRVASEYSSIKADHYIIDIGAAKLAADPERFDVIVTMNLYGDIISDIAAEVAGSVGMGGSSNVGENHAMYEAIHGSAPDIAGKDVANPSGLLNAACMMLSEMGKVSVSESIQNALLKTLEDGVHTPDIFKIGLSNKKVGTKEFTDEIISRLGLKPVKFRPLELNKESGPLKIIYNKPGNVIRILKGADIFLESKRFIKDPLQLGRELEEISRPAFTLKGISNRGVQTYPENEGYSTLTSQWRCRFMAANGEALKQSELIELLARLDRAGFDITKTENLYVLDGELGYSVNYGE